jgi:NADPH:quinone reductase-like Zn-dependent oxidoreductase
MKTVAIARHGGPEVLALRDAPTPLPGPGQLRIAVAAAGVNFADILIRQGLYPGGRRPPCVPGYEVAGVVDATGDGVDPGWQGRSVLALTDYDGYAEYHVIGAERVLPCPDTLEPAVAAALPLNYITAWVLLIVMGSLRADQTVLIHNAGGGVGLAALDIARHLGARTLGTASPGKHAFLRGRGLDHAIDYRRPDWPQKVRELTDGEGLDLVIDPLGPRSWRLSLTLLGPTGRLGVFGISEASASGFSGKLGLIRSLLRAPIFHPARLLTGNRGVFGCNVHRMYERTAALNRWLSTILEGVEAGWVRPHVDRSFALADAAEAHRWIESRRNVGKVLLEI